MKTKKILIFPLIVLASFSPLSIPKANAMIAVPVGDVLNMPTHTGGLLGATAFQTFQNIMKMTLDSLAYGAGQLILNQLTENTINWIQGGFHGSPSFAVDTTQLEQDMLDAVAGNLINQIKDLSVCQFRINYTDDLTNSVLLSTKKRYNPKCPFPDNVTTMNFYASDAVTAVNSFGWSAYSAALADSGNPYSVQVATAQELEQQKQAQKQASDQKLSWSNGYADLIDTGDCNYPDTVATAMNGAPGNGVTPAVIQSWQKAYCKTTTPGNIVSTQLSKTLGLDMDRLGFADNMNKIIAALLKRLTQDTVRGVFGSHPHT